MADLGVLYIICLGVRSEEDPPGSREASGDAKRSSLALRTRLGERRLLERLYGRAAMTTMTTMASIRRKTSSHGTTTTTI